MAAAQTYEPIATTNISSGTSVTFSSIPSTYTDLILVVNGKSTEATGVSLQFNGDTGSNYSWIGAFGSSGTTTSSGGNNVTGLNMGVFYTSQSANIIQIMNYANTSVNKTVLSRANNFGFSISMRVGLWRSTAAINSIKVECSNYQPTSYLTLYGIKAA
jgi:hypothetical protein